MHMGKVENIFDFLDLSSEFSNSIRHRNHHFANRQQHGAYGAQRGAYGVQRYNANLPVGSLKSQVYFLQQELTRISGHIDQVMQQARITPSPNRKVCTN